MALNVLLTAIIFAQLNTQFMAKRKHNERGCDGRVCGISNESHGYRTYVHVTSVDFVQQCIKTNQHTEKLSAC